MVCCVLQVVYPKPTDKPLYNGLMTQCRTLGIPFPDWQALMAPTAASSGPGRSPLHAHADVVLDALFGFSFKGAARPPFDDILKVRMQRAARAACAARQLAAHRMRMRLCMRRSAPAHLGLGAMS